MLLWWNHSGLASAGLSSRFGGKQIVPYAIFCVQFAQSRPLNPLADFPPYTSLFVGCTTLSCLRVNVGGSSEQAMPMTERLLDILDLLPAELWLKAFSWLRIRDLKRLCLVCHPMKDLARLTPTRVSQLTGSAEVIGEILSQWSGLQVDLVTVTTSGEQVILILPNLPYTSTVVRPGGDTPYPARHWPCSSHCLPTVFATQTWEIASCRAGRN